MECRTDAVVGTHSEAKHAANVAKRAVHAIRGGSASGAEPQIVRITRMLHFIIPKHFPNVVILQLSVRNVRVKHIIENVLHRQSVDVASYRRTESRVPERMV